MASRTPDGRRFRALASEVQQTRVTNTLGELALDLRDAAHATPRPEFVDALRTRLLAVAAVNPPAPAHKPTIAEWSTSWTPSARRSRLAVTLVAGAVVVGAAGVAGARSLPGQPFYDVKQASESLQLAFTHGDAARGALHLKFAARRLAELEKLTGTSSTQLSAASTGETAVLTSLGETGKGTLKTVRDTLNAMDKETRAGASLLTTAFEVTKNRETMHTLGSFAQRQAARLQSVLTALPTAEQTRALNSLSLVLQVQGQAYVLAATAPIDTNTTSTPTSAPTIVQTPSPMAHTLAHPTAVLIPHFGAPTTGSEHAAATPEPSSTDASGAGASSGSGSSAGSGSSTSQPGGTPSQPTPTRVTIVAPVALPPTCVDVTTLIGLPPVCIVPPQS